MKLVYTNENRFFVNNVKNILENAGIKVLLKNEFTSSVIGEVSPTDGWLELWVANVREHKTAKKIIQDRFSQHGSVDWQCSHCSEINDASFDFCWQCQTEKDLQTNVL